MKKDLRFEKTEAQIKGAFITLIEEKGYARITVSDIAKKAMINRNTFYLHYAGKEDLIDRLTSEVFDEQQKRILEMCLPLFPNVKQEGIYNLIINLLQVVNKEIELYRILLTDIDLSGYIVKLKRGIRQKVNSMLTNFYYINQITLEFCISGIFGVMEKWIVSNFASMEEIARIISEKFVNMSFPKK